MIRAARVGVVGSINVDLTLRTARLPAPGETVTGWSFRVGFGGKGANQAVMAARLGARVTLVGCVGSDPFAEQALAALAAEGIDTAHVRVAPGETTGTAAILVEETGQNCIVVVPGANAALTAADVRRAAAALQEADVVLVQNEVPPEATLEALGLARAAGVRTLANPAPAGSFLPAFFELASVCIPNEIEAQVLTGRRIITREDASEAAELLRQQGAEAVIVTLGADGAVVVGDGCSCHLPPHRVEAVDSTGAGDAFIGALAVGLGEGLDLVEAARRASVAAALSVTRPGAQASFPRRSELEAVLRTQSTT
jgi:ribokinase